MSKCGNLFIRFMLFLACSRGEYIARSEISSSRQHAAAAYTNTYIHTYTLLDTKAYLCTLIHSWTYDNTKKNMCCVSLRVYTLAAGGGDTLFWNSKGNQRGSKRKRERVREGAAEQRKGTTTWRIVACRELLRMATVRQCGGERWGCNTGLTKFPAAAG